MEGRRASESHDHPATGRRAKARAGEPRARRPLQGGSASAPPPEGHQCRAASRPPSPSRRSTAGRWIGGRRLRPRLSEQNEERGGEDDGADDPGHEAAIVAAGEGRPDQVAVVGIEGRLEFAAAAGDVVPAECGVGRAQAVETDVVLVLRAERGPCRGL